MQLSTPRSRNDQSVGKIASLIPHGTETLANIDALVMKTDAEIRNYPMTKVRSKRNFNDIFHFPHFFYKSITILERILYNREDADLTMKLEFNSTTIHTVEVRVFGIAVYRVSSLYASAYRCIWKISFSRIYLKLKCAHWSICRV